MPQVWRVVTTFGLVCKVTRHPRKRPFSTLPREDKILVRDNQCFCEFALWKTLTWRGFTGGSLHGFSFGFSGSALVESRYIASLATKNPDGSTHMVAVWYWFDGARIYIATSTRTRKARNLRSTPQISLMIDSRDPAASCGINIVGAAQFLTGEVSREWNGRVYAKYLSDAALADPRVGPVFASWDDVTIQITPTSVIAWDMREADRQVFGSAFESNPTYLLPLER